MRFRGGSLIASLVVALSSTACGDGSGKDPFVRVPSSDASADADADASSAPLPDAGPFDPTLGGPCTDDGQCNDGLACTYDACDLTAGSFGDAGVGRCRYTVDDTQCADDLFCNGRERCVLGLGCRPGPVETCQDQDSCTIDTCDEATKSCKHAPRDLDKDGDPDDRCTANKDCDDLDPAVSSTHVEVCGNAKDDNCNGQKDEAGCATPAADTCATALAVVAPGTYALSTLAASDDLAITCGVAGPDVVASITIPPGTNKDLDLWARASGAELAVGVQSTCGSAPTELACRKASSATRVRARNLAPGTYAVIVKTEVATPLELAVDFLDPTSPPTNETCATATPITVGTPFDVSLVDPTKDVPTSCNSQAGELVYSFSLAQASDIRVFTTVTNGAAAPVTTLRSAACTTATDELRCREGNSLPLFARNLPAGSYRLTVGAFSPLDANVLVQASTPSVASADETCTAPPAVVINGSLAFDLDAHDDDVDNGCYDGNPDAAYALSLALASDVLLVGRFPPNDTGSLSLGAADCSSASRLGCAIADSPVRLSRRNVAPGTYRVGVADNVGRKGTLSTFVRSTMPPTSSVGADSCTSAFTIPSIGGYFVGSTATALHDFSSGCDQAGSPSANDHVFKLDLTQTKRVVLDMSTSNYTTLLSIRSGATCPGTEVPGACHVGFSAQRSFLERVLTPGTYWIVVDGYAGETGDYGLDVRILDP